ncbi:hypothetical protein HYV57_02515 [Candidatus Peregrinibacteria bacterium]|nr:hypothetical protein [Candidatus Peregrinibacteria bacterium]
MHPTMCPDCRQQRRLAFRNERRLYHRKCDLTGKQVISLYSPDKPYKVYEQKEWWGDQWDPLSFGRDFDFKRHFFEQFQELLLAVPRANIYSKNNTNSDYTTNCDRIKNCYLSVDIANSEGIYYGKWVLNSKDCLEMYEDIYCELDYENLYSDGNYQCVYTLLSDHCSDCQFLYDCKGCKYCFMCFGLRNKEYCIENKQVSKEDYDDFFKKIRIGSYEQYRKCVEIYENMIKKIPRKANILTNCENCTGDFQYNCKNVKDSYDIISSEDVKYAYDASNIKDSMDVYEPAFNCELQYESYACNRGVNIIGCAVSYDISDSYYCDICHNSANLFGCVGLKHKRYCILNKQYSREEYEELIPKIIEHMKKTGEWGEFFPIQLSPFAYNESVAEEYFPLQKEEVLERGWKWQEEEKVSQQCIGSKTHIPDHIDDADESICGKILFCEVTGKLYKIIPQEFQFYKKMGIPIPRRCPDQRYKERMERRNPRKLWSRICMKCQAAISTSYAPDRQEIVYCENCYLKEVY